MRTIFISYRREDAEGQAGRLFNDLSRHFGATAVFMDVAGIEPGRDFRRVIDDKVSSCGVLLALIGKDWLDAADKQGKRRLDDPLDFVRLETASALKRDIPVIPVLVQDASMPLAAQLPADIADLAYRNGVELTHARWDSDVQLLVKALAPYVDTPSKPENRTKTSVPASGGSRSAGKRARLGIAAASAALLLGGAYALITPTPDAPKSASQSTEIKVTRKGHGIAEEYSATRTTGQSPKESQAPAAETANAEAIKQAVENAKAEHEKLAREKARLQAEAERLAAEKARLQAGRSDAAVKARERIAATEFELAQRERVALGEASRRINTERRRTAATGNCVQGYVWREAGPNDRVCVTPASRAQAESDNRLAAARRQPGGGAYGPATCRQGYVWREAYAGDTVCVTPDIRTRTAEENARAATRIASR